MILDSQVILYCRVCRAYGSGGRFRIQASVSDCGLARSARCRFPWWAVSGGLFHADIISGLGSAGPVIK